MVWNCTAAELLIPMEDCPSLQGRWRYPQRETPSPVLPVPTPTPKLPMCIEGRRKQNKMRYTLRNGSVTLMKSCVLPVIRKIKRNRTYLTNTQNLAAWRRDEAKALISWESWVK